MVLTLSEVSGSLQDRYHGDIQETDSGLLRASANFAGETIGGGMAFRSKRSAVCSDSPTTSHGSTLSVSSMISTSPSKPSVMSSSSVCSKPIPIVLQKKHSSYTDKGQFHTWIDAMRAQSPPHIHSLHGDTPEAFDLEAQVYKSWLVSTFALYLRQSYFSHIESLTPFDKSSACVCFIPQIHVIK